MLHACIIYIYYVTFKAQSQFVAHNILKLVVLFYRENKTIVHVTHLPSIADESHEMQSLVFSVK